VDWAWRTNIKDLREKQKASDELDQQTQDNFIVVPLGLIN